MIEAEALALPIGTDVYVRYTKTGRQDTDGYIYVVNLNGGNVVIHASVIEAIAPPLPLKVGDSVWRAPYAYRRTIAHIHGKDAFCTIPAGKNNQSGCEIAPLSELSRDPPAGYRATSQGLAPEAGR